MIEVKNLTKKYGDNTAVKNLSFTVEKGKIYGFLGPNGAGKSTTMNIITGCLAATEGEVLINGHDIFEDPYEAKKCIGYLPEQPPLYPEMTPYEYLTFVAEAKSIPYDQVYNEVERVMDATGIIDVRDRLIKNLSKGYKQRVGIAQAMIGSPEIIILDEPTVGLDPIQIIEIRELIKSLGKSHTVILSSHILSEVSAVCDHVMIISGGTLIASDAIDNLGKYLVGSTVMTLIAKGDPDRIKGAAEDIRDVTVKSVSPAAHEAEGVYEFIIESNKDDDIREKIFRKVCETNSVILNMDTQKMGLEEVFLKLTSEEGAEAEEDAPEASSGRKKEKPKKITKPEKDDESDYKPLFTVGGDDEKNEKEDK